jgi:GTP-binding protein
MTAPQPRLPVVAIVGRPNVGKSTLVNRIVGKRIAIVEERPGVTRDRKFLDAEWTGRQFVIADTGGWLPEPRRPMRSGHPGGSSRRDGGASEGLRGEPGGEQLDAQVSAQAERALRGADVAVLVVDVTIGATDEDSRVAALLRQVGVKTVLAANKVDGDTRDADAWEFSRLGLGDPSPVSALHGRGTGDLLDRIVALLPPEQPVSEEEVDDAATRVPGVAIVGRPNVGKSTLFNRLVGDERSIVHDQPGTTRDTVDTVVETAGMRRKSRIDEGTEYYSLVRALQAVDEADAALLVIDATQSVTHQDQRLAERVDAAGSPVVILLNKWELLDTEAREQLTDDVADRLGFLGYAPVLKISALTGKGVPKLVPALREALDAYGRRVPTAELNTVIQLAQSAHPPPRGKVLYATQGATDPPTFTLFANRDLPASYLRYLERKIRERFEFGPTPLKLRVRTRAR